MFDYIDGAAGKEIATNLNEQALDAIRLQPRVLVNVENRDLRKRFLGQERSLPFGIAPMGMCNLAWPAADKMLAKEALRRQIPLCVSTVASTRLEDMLLEGGENTWFQLYVSESLQAGLNLAERAQSIGYTVLILTVDVPQVAKRPRDARNGFHMPFRIGPRQLVDFACHPRWALETLLNGPPTPANFTAHGRNNAGGGFVRNASRGQVDWNFLDQLREFWKGKLIVKGVLCSEDAQKIKATGVDAIYVSNHGGRQLDAAPAAIHRLAAIRNAVGDDYPLIFDSGVRSGEAIVKSLALGADFVMLGRTVLYAIGADGARGLTTMLDLLSEETSQTLAQIGLRSVEDIDGSVVETPTERNLI